MDENDILRVHFIVPIPGFGKGEWSLGRDHVTKHRLSKDQNGHMTTPMVQVPRPLKKANTNFQVNLKKAPHLSKPPF